MVEFSAELNEGLAEADSVRCDVDYIKGLR
jgi:hypothetical protein